MDKIHTVRKKTDKWISYKNELSALFLFLYYFFFNRFIPFSNWKSLIRRVNENSRCYLASERDYKSDCWLSLNKKRRRGHANYLTFASRSGEHDRRAASRGAAKYIYPTGGGELNRTRKKCSEYKLCLIY